MANTYVAIATVTVGSGGASSIDFTSIPQTYTDLKITLSTRSDVSGQNDYPRISFNGSAANQTLRAVQGNGSATASYTDTLIYSVGAGDTVTANTFGNSEFYIPSYTASVNKSVSSDGVNENNATGAIASLFAGLWSQTAAITSISIIPYHSGAKFKQYSTFTLYGIKNS